MAKTKPADEFDGIPRLKLYSIIRATRGELARSNEKLAEAEANYDKAWGVAADWKERTNRVEKDNRNLETSRDALQRMVEVLSGQVNRCVGFIAAKMGDHPAEEAKPETMVPDKDYDNWQHRDGRARAMGETPPEEPPKHWRKALGLETGYTF